MSRPRIYGRCAAGCKWETVHRAEFEEMAPYIKKDTTGGRCFLEMGKQYKIRNVGDTNSWNFEINFIYFEEDEMGTVNPYTVSLKLPTFDSKEPWIDFKLLDYGATRNAVYAVYEINGNRVEGALIEKLGNFFVLTENNDFLEVCSVGGNLFGVYEKNIGAEWVIIPHQVFIRYSADGGITMTETWSEGQTYIGFYTGTQASNNPSDYSWAKFVGSGSTNISEKLRGDY